MPCSKQFDSYRSGIDFKIEFTHPNFKDSGLRHESYVVDYIAEIKGETIRKRWGQLVGDLADEFDKWLNGDEE
jgi:hypothetical protein